VTDPAWRDPPAQEPRPSPAGPVWDAVVVGLGALGSAAAWALARAGARVLGLEQFELGHHRGGVPRPRAHHPPLLPHARLRAPGRLAYQAWEKLEREAGERLVVTTGGLDLFPATAAIRPGPYRASLEACGVPYHWLDAAEVMRRWPAFRRTPTSTACGRPTAASSRPPAAPGSCSAWPPASAPPCSTGPR
jgi:sarcosine oxidase